MYKILELNPQLQSCAWDIDLRMAMYEGAKNRLLPEGGSGSFRYIGEKICTLRKRYPVSAPRQGRDYRPRS